jgi:hypothetical protein
VVTVTASWFRSSLTDRKQKTEIKSSDLTQSTYSNWGTVKHGVPQGSILGPLLFLVDTNDLAPTLNTSSIHIIFTDDASVIISSKNLDDFCILSNKILSRMSKWFPGNKLFLNEDKTNVIHFITECSPQFPLNIGYNDKHIEDVVNTKFLGLQSDNYSNWKKHINQLVPLLSGVCCVVRSMLHISNTDTLKSICFAYLCSLMKYGIIFLVYSSDSK